MFQRRMIAVANQKDVFIAENFGTEFWILNRRTYKNCIKLIGPKLLAQIIAQILHWIDLYMGVLIQHAGEDARKDILSCKKRHTDPDWLAKRGDRCPQFLPQLVFKL